MIKLGFFQIIDPLTGLFICLLQREKKTDKLITTVVYFHREGQCIFTQGMCGSFLRMQGCKKLSPQSREDALRQLFFRSQYPTRCQTV